MEGDGMQVVQIEEFDKKRVRVVLDDGYSFPLYKGERRQYGLEEGQELPGGVLDEIRTEILAKRARKRALHLLERMDRTEYQLRTRLQQGYYPEDIVEDAVAYVKEYHYLDDLRYARNYVRCHKDTKSRRMLQVQLLGKGVSREEAGQAIEEAYGLEDETEQILGWIRKKHYSVQEADRRDKQRMYAFLMRKGFSSNDILHVLEHLT